MGNGKSSNEFLSCMVKVLQGDFNDYSKIKDGINVKINGSVETRRYLSSRKLRVFVSSTFTDTHTERNILLDEIVPLIKSIAAPYGIQVVFVDMRYGVRDENTLDHMTWLACLSELQNCLEQSSGIYFLSLQSNKYGYQPIPKYIPQSLFDAKYSSSSSEDQVILKEWYHLDTNNQPPRYILKNLTDVNDPIFWNEALPRIRQCLKDLAFDESKDYTLIGRSVTEYEAKVAMQSSANRMKWMARTFPGGVNATSDRPWDYDDSLNDPTVKLKLESLLAQMHSELQPLSNVIPIKVPFDSYIAKDGIGKEYEASWKEKVVSIFTKEIESIIANKQAWDLDSFGLGCEGGVVDEMLHHSKLANDKCSDFSGREELIEKAMKCISGGNANNMFKISLCLIGVSGSGKTALVSKLASLTRQKFSSIPVIVRFCGTSGSSNHGLDLITSICKQIELLYNLKKKQVSDVYKEAVEYFHSLLSKYPVMLFIDSLDQLSNSDQARAKISFLDKIPSLHKKSRIIVSALPDELEKGYFYQCDSSLAKASVPRVIVDAIAEPQSIVTSLLSVNCRSLTDSQMKYFLTQAAVEPTALYIKLSIKVIEKWTSFEKDMVLDEGVRGLINQLFDTFERDFGKVLVRAILGLITFSVGGLNITHIQDLLSLNEEVISSTFQYSKPTKLQIPIHVILRLYQALDGLVVEREDGKISWYHRQLKEAAYDRYQSDEKNHHVLLATYFGNLVDTTLHDTRLVSEQPIVFGKSTSPWSKKAIINRTSCIEGVSHMLKSKDPMMLVEAYKKLCSVEYIFSSCKVGEGYQLILYLTELEKLMKISDYVQALKECFEHHKLDYDEVSIKVYHYLRWLRMDMSTIVKNPSAYLIETAGKQPLISKARVDVQAFLHQSYKSSGVSLKDISSSTDVCYRGRSLGGANSFDSCLLVITGSDDRDNVTCCSFSPDGNRIVSASKDCSLHIFNATTGSEELKMTGHEYTVSAVSFSPDCSRCVSGSLDNTIRVWNAFIGNELLKIDNGYGINSVLFSPDGSRIVSGSEDGIVRIWNSLNGNLVLKMTGHDKGVHTRTCSLSPDGTRIISGSRYGKENSLGSIIIFDSTTGSLIQKIDNIEVSNTRCSSCSFSPDGSRILSVSRTSIHIYDATSGSEILRIERHLPESASFSPDGSRIISTGSGNLYLIDANTGNEELSIEYQGRGDQESTCPPSFNHDGSQCVLGSGNSIVIYDVTQTSETTRFDTDTYFDVGSCSFSPDGTRVASDDKDGIVLWNATSGTEILKIKREVSFRSFSPDGSRILSDSSDNSLRIYDATTGNEIMNIMGHDDRVTFASFSHDGSRILSGSGFEVTSVRIWDSKTGNLILKMPDYVSQSRGTFSHDDKRIIFGSDSGSVWISDAVTGSKQLEMLKDGGPPIYSVSFSHDDKRCISGSDDSSIRVWNSIKGNMIIKTTCIGYPVSSCSFSPDDSQIVSGSRDGIVRIWNSVNGNLISSLSSLSSRPDGSSGITSCSFSPDGSFIVSSSVRDSTLRIWDAIEV